MLLCASFSESQTRKHQDLSSPNSAMKALKRLRETTLEGGTQGTSGSTDTDDSSSVDVDDLYDSFDILTKSMDDDEHDDFAEVRNSGEELVKLLAGCTLCLIPEGLRYKLLGTDSLEDDISLEEGDETKEQYSADSQFLPDERNTRIAAKSPAQEDDDDNFIEAISAKLPQCQDVTADFVKNKLHKLVKKKRWSELQHQLMILSSSDKSSFSLASEKEQLQLMIRQVDENGRTPLSLACGKSQAPPEIIQLLLDGCYEAASVEDRNGNLPLHHFCHSYGRLADVDPSLSPERSKEDSPSDQIIVLKEIHSAYPAGTRHANSYGNTPLHVYIEHQCSNNMTQSSLRVAHALLNLDPGAAHYVNKSGSLPMHYIGKKNNYFAHQSENPSEMKERALMTSFLIDLHEANPNAVMATNNFGATPFLVAVIYNASYEVWQGLLSIYPEAATLQSGRGMSPIATFWNMFVSMKAKKKYFNFTEQQALEEGGIIEKNRLLMSRIMCPADLRINCPARLFDFWIKMELMIRAASYGSTLEKIHAGETWSPIHSICMIEECPCDLLKFALQMYGEETRKRDLKGNLPIHVLLQNVRKNASARQAENAKTMVEHLLRVSPTSVSCRTQRGELPLHIALRSFLTWNTGIRSLAEADAVTVEVRDPVTKLFPFMLAAVGDPIFRSLSDDDQKHKNFSTILQTGELEQLNTIYGLLILSPGMAHPKPKRKKPLSERGAEVMRLQQRRVNEKHIKTRKEILELRHAMQDLQRQNELLVKRGGSVRHGIRDTASLKSFNKMFKRGKDTTKNRK